MTGLHICLIAGEASGDFLGAQLMAALKDAAPGVHFSGVAVPLMAAAGLASLFPMETLSVMGIAEILPRLPDILARIRQVARHVQTAHPDIVVTIDAPDFCFRVVHRVRAAGGKRPKFIHYVAPSVWAWRPERAAKLAQLYDGVLCLLPFEPPYFEREGLRAVFVGHPVLQAGLDRGDRGGCRHRLNIPDGANCSACSSAAGAARSRA